MRWLVTLWISLITAASPGGAHATVKTWRDLHACLNVLIPVSQQYPVVPKAAFEANGLTYQIPTAFHPKLNDIVRTLGISGEIKEKWLRALEVTFLGPAEFAARYPYATPPPTQSWTEFLMRETALGRSLREVFESRRATSQAAAVLESLRTGAELEEVAVVTHANEEWQAPTAAYLARPEFANIPVISLVNPTHRLTAQALYDRSDLIVFSPAGEVDPYWVNARTVHLFGGSCALCLSGTVEAVIKGFVKNSLKDRMTVYFHSNYIYNNRLRLSQMVSQAGPSFFLGDTLELFDIQGLQLEMSRGEIVSTKFGPGLKFLMTSKVMKISISMVVLGVKDAPRK